MIIHAWARQDGSARCDAMTIARVLLSGEARAGYIPSERVATYRELVRLHTQLSDEAARYQNEIQALLVVLFPEFTQVFADPCLPSAAPLSEHTAHRWAVQGGYGSSPSQRRPQVSLTGGLTNSIASCEGDRSNVCSPTCYHSYAIIPSSRCILAIPLVVVDVFSRYRSSRN